MQGGSMASKWVGRLVMFMWAPSACIAGESRQGSGDTAIVPETKGEDATGEVTSDVVDSDTTATSETDTGTVTVTGPSDTADDTGLGDTGVSDSIIIVDDTGAGDSVVGDATEPGCQIDDDCLNLVTAVPSQGCVRAWCNAGTCQVDNWNEGDPCDDGNACTDGDTCNSQTCMGVETSCGDLACYQVTGCDPQVGCTYAPADAGTACDDGQGTPSYECIDGWYGPDDVCDGDGTCVGGVFDPPADGFPLAGEWYAVISSALPGGFDTLRARFSISALGQLTVSGAQSSAAIWASQMNGTGGACAAPAGRIVFAPNGYAYAGVLSEQEDVVVFGGYTTHELGIAVRPDGTPTDIDGTYHMISSASVQSGSNPSQLITWVGSIVFDRGCVAARTSFTTTAGVPNGGTFWYADNDGACFEGAEGIVHLSLRLLPSADADPDTQGFGIVWRGAVAQQGDLVLLTRDGPSTSVPLYGTIVLLRDSSAKRLDDLVGGWAFLGQRGGASAVAPNSGDPRLEQGELDLPATGTPLEGWIGDFNSSASDVNGGWFAVGHDTPRYSQRVVLDNDVIHHGGWIGPRADFIMGWVAPPVSSAASPRDLGGVPAEGSLFFMTRPSSWQ
ncbi:MAG: hypothetical protein U1F43_19855 [Myxococcota bacterium]